MQNTAEKKVHGDIVECPKCKETSVHPKITVDGDLVRIAGFDFGDKVQVISSPGHIVISRCLS
ncbi:MAG: type I toxin-antitoxin system SymE family toxin [Cytophagales bacterium]|nr:type I toxin-antitoxin system SymE family toxin [Cytophagales bacterium]